MITRREKENSKESSLAAWPVDGSVAAPVFSRKDQDGRPLLIPLVVGVLAGALAAHFLVLWAFVSVCALVVCAELYRLFLRPIPVLGVSRSGVRLTVRGREAQRIEWDDLAEIQNPRADSTRINLISRTGEQIKLRGVHGVAHPALDALATRLPSRVRLTPERAEFKPLTKRQELFRLVGGGALISLSLIVWFAFLDPLAAGYSLGAAALLVIAGAGCVLAFSVSARRRLAQEPWRWDPESPEPITRVSQREMMVRGEMPQTLEPNYEYAYAPVRKVWHDSEQIVLFVLAGVWVMSVALMTNSVLQIAVGVLLLLVGAFIVFARLPRRTRHARHGDRVRVENREIIVTSTDGTVRRAPYTQRALTWAKARLLPGRLFGLLERYEGDQGVVEIDSRYLVRTDRPVYTPESPWKDLWRGRHLPR